MAKSVPMQRSLGDTQMDRAVESSSNTNIRAAVNKSEDINSRFGHVGDEQDTDMIAKLLK